MPRPAFNIWKVPSFHSSESSRCGLFAEMLVGCGLQRASDLPISRGRIDDHLRGPGENRRCVHKNEETHMRRTMTEKKGAWILGALLVAGVHGLVSHDRGDAGYASSTLEPTSAQSGVGLVPTRDVSSLWPFGTSSGLAGNGAGTATNSSAHPPSDMTPSFSSIAGETSPAGSGPSQGR